MNPIFCMDDNGGLKPCPPGHIRHPVTTLATTTNGDIIHDLEEVQAASQTHTDGASHDQTVLVESNYSSLDFHPQTLFLSGISCLLIVAVITLCFCCVKKATKFAKSFIIPRAPRAPHHYEVPRR